MIWSFSEYSCIEEMIVKILHSEHSNSICDCSQAGVHVDCLLILSQTAEKH